jgi:hypothetical protein
MTPEKSNCHNSGPPSEEYGINVASEEHCESDNMLLSGHSFSDYDLESSTSSPNNRRSSSFDESTRNYGRVHLFSKFFSFGK